MGYEGEQRVEFVHAPGVGFAFVATARPLLACTRACVCVCVCVCGCVCVWGSRVILNKT